MRIYLWILGLCFFMTSPSFAADEDDTEYSENAEESSEEKAEENSDNDAADDEESEDSDEEGDQNDSQPYGMIPQSGFIQQQNMMFANQPYIDQNGMIYQNGMMNQNPNEFQNNTMMPNYQDPNGFKNNILMPQQNLSEISQTAENSSGTKDRIRSIVNRLLGISGKVPENQEQRDLNAVQNTELQNKLEKLREYMGEIIQESKENINDITQTPIKSEDSFLDKEVKNLLIQLQQRINGVVQNKVQKYQREMIQSLNGIPLVKKSVVYKTVAPKKSIKAKLAPKRSKWNRKLPKKSNSYTKKYSKPDYTKGYYTIKQFTPENDRRYVPKPFFSNSSQVSSMPNSSEKVGGYVIKNWGTKATTVVNSTQNSIPASTPAQNNYFSKKSDCGCSLF